MADGSKPHVLFTGTKWLNGDPQNGVNALETFAYGPLTEAGVATCTFFPIDEHYLLHGEACDDILLTLCAEKRPDIYMLVWWPGAPRLMNPSLETLYKIQVELGIPIVALWYDTWANWLVAEAEMIRPFVDLAVVSDSILHFGESPCLDKYINLAPPISFRFFNDPGITRDIDLSFNGGASAYQDRMLGLEFLRKSGIDVVKAGGELEDRLTRDEYAKVFMRSKISLNWSGSGKKKTLKARTLEATLCGSMLLESANPETARIFRPMVDYVPFEDDIDLVEKVRYYLEHDDERLRIAESGKERAQFFADGGRYWRHVLELVDRERRFEEHQALDLLVRSFVKGGDFAKASAYLCSPKEHDSAYSSLGGRGISVVDQACPWFSPLSGTIFIEVSRTQSEDEKSESTRVISFNDGSFRNYFDILIDEPGQQPLFHSCSNGVSGPFLAGKETWRPGAKIQICLRYDEDKLSFCVDGLECGTVERPALPMNIRSLLIGRDCDNNVCTSTEVLSIAYCEMVVWDADALKELTRT